MNSEERIPKKKKKLVKAPKAYDNSVFLHSPSGRPLRMLSEYLYPLSHLKKNNIRNFVIFFGSARIPSMEQFHEREKSLIQQLNIVSGQEKFKIETILNSLNKRKFLSENYEQAVELSHKLSEWSKTLPKQNRFSICSGGGHGMMEAANKGAWLAGAKTVGLNISLPFEQFPNKYISKELNFEFHYFFMRKFWFVYLAQAIVVMPGGFGTLDEFFDLITLIQTNKLSKTVPVVLYNKEFWEKVINFDYLKDISVISDSNLEIFRYADSPAEAFDYLKEELTRIYQLPDKKEYKII